MTQAKKVMVVLGIFFLGGAAERIGVPPARADSGVQRWEYACKQEGGRAQEVTDMANRLGAQGWQLVVNEAAAGIWCFKRASP
jgi:hypothetical protein